MADDEDDRDKYGKADDGKDWDGLGFLQFTGPHGAVETLPVPPEEDKEQKPSGNVVPSITPSDEMRLYADLFAHYGTPRMVRLKALFAYSVLVLGGYIMFVTTSPVALCAAAGLVAVIGVAYILCNTAG